MPGRLVGSPSPVPARNGRTVIFTDPSLRSIALFLRFWIIFIPIASTKNFAIASTSVARKAICLILAMSASFDLLLPAVKNLVAQIFHHQSRIVGTAGRLYRYAGVFHFADKDRVIAFFNCIHKRALHESRGLF